MPAIADDAVKQGHDNYSLMSAARDSRRAAASNRLSRVQIDLSAGIIIKGRGEVALWNPACCQPIAQDGALPRARLAPSRLLRRGPISRTSRSTAPPGQAIHHRGLWSSAWQRRLGRIKYGITCCGFPCPQGGRARTGPACAQQIITNLPRHCRTSRTATGRAWARPDRGGGRRAR